MQATPSETLSLANYTPEVRQQLFRYVLQLADTSLILGHRLSEWCGHGPVLEQDLAMANIALDLLGETRSLYQYAAELEGQDRTEDDLAFLRLATEYQNPLLVEQPNGDFAATVVRQFLFDNFHYHFLQQLQTSPDERLAAIAEKAWKEAAYHLKWSSEWIIRLGDGTEESRQRVEKALGNLWRYSGELTASTATEQALQRLGLIPDYATLLPAMQAHVAKVFEEATLPVPQEAYMQKGGKEGRHTEHLGYILAELQYMQRTYPGLKW
ncbi:phenylacetate-CoA oxygenase subunit PaaC [Hymenobacter taeanensis]|uniref:Phenylacetate-CoA oxygenase subunit PaaC n=1 Tax=Hymenobacter taeanensis TaxID=2735321 RepID=A0A6M6BJ41_9BACT|nr:MULTISPECIES: 1,2-phenylacetyl-CoA epoxidase subunit PaaC [Hymenobacter]QJX48106.1 phenylacetate-CoA oxygenase subunit PaaC [Hymenobacter taeanensis]UOQ82427.1 phenylacetate-CoA oxygenase subunit PaaC [Hymenobacter sp. 5414T-23]